MYHYKFRLFFLAQLFCLAVLTFSASNLSASETPQDSVSTQVSDRGGGGRGMGGGGGFHGSGFHDGGQWHGDRGWGGDHHWDGYHNNYGYGVGGWGVTVDPYYNNYYNSDYYNSLPYYDPSQYPSNQNPDGYDVVPQ